MNYNDYHLNYTLQYQWTLDSQFKFSAQELIHCTEVYKVFLPDFPYQYIIGLVGVAMICNDYASVFPLSVTHACSPTLVAGHV